MLFHLAKSSLISWRWAYSRASISCLCLRSNVSLFLFSLTTLSSLSLFLAAYASSSLPSFSQILRCSSKTYKKSSVTTSFSSYGERLSMKLDVFYAALPSSQLVLGLWSWFYKKILLVYCRLGGIWIKYNWRYVVVYDGSECST